MTPAERIQAGECSKDEGGYFMIRGKERALIPQLRGVYNIPKIIEQKTGGKYKYIAEMRSMSEETGHSALLKAMIGVDNRTLVFSLPYIREIIPIGVVFKALGYLTAEEISNFIGLNCNKTSKYIHLIIRDAYFCEEQSNGFKLYSESNKTLKPTIIQEKWEKLSTPEQNIWKDKLTNQNALKFIGQYAIHTLKDTEYENYARQVVENELFPHLGITASKKTKAFLLGVIVNKLISTHTGLRKDDDRDDYINKRVESAGILCYELVRQLFKKYCLAIATNIDKKKQIPDAMSIIMRLPIITNGLRHCFSTGNWGVPKNSYIRSGVSQILSRLSFGATLSTLRRVTIPIGKESKNTKIRQIHPSQIMFLCPAETPEGASVGIVLNLSLLTRISERVPTVFVKEVVEKCENLILIENFDGPNELTKVFLNGILLGMTTEPFNLLDEIKVIRSVKLLPYHVSVSYDDIDDEISIYSDEGRLLRPVFVVKNNKLQITPEDGTDWDELIEKGCIKYLDNNEINNAVVAFHPNELEKYHNDYCEIAPAMMLGVMASIIPFPDHSQSPRNCYQAAMGKQAMSIFTLSHLIRADTVTHVLTYPQRPLVSTKSADMMGFNEMPSGINAVVAIACYTGYNQEDSVIINEGAIQKGLFWATTYRTHSEEEKKQGTYNFERIGVPPLDKRRRDVNYALLDEHGVVRLRLPTWTDSNGKICGGGNVYVESGDVIIAKVMIQSSKLGQEELTDNSLVIKKGEEGYIDRIFISTTPNGYKLIKVVVRTIRIPEVGDKFASRAAQKGTCGRVCSQVDMPWTQSGMVPDIIINPHCMPSRMTINQLMETVLGKSCSLEGTFGDATPFTKSSINIAEKLCQRLKMNLHERTGLEILYNGMTGEKMGTAFIGPVYYQRLKHLVSEKMHARAQGPNATLTHQPLEGRSRDGGLRFGEMERDCNSEDTLITLCTGLSIKIKNMENNNIEVIGYDEEKQGLVKAKQTNFMYKGTRPCVEITLEDGRKTICTEDHPLLTEQGEWVKAKDLIIGQDNLKVGITCPEMDIDKEINECNNWTLKVGNITLKTNTTEEYLKTLAFVRIIGLLITDGHISKDNRGSVFLGHKLDISPFMHDLNMFCDKEHYCTDKHCYTVCIPQHFMKNIIKLDGLIIGKKVNQAAVLPKFVLDCPKPVLREFLGGMFGGDGHTCFLGLHRGKRDILSSVGFSKSKTKDNVESLLVMLGQIKELLLKFGIKEVTIQNPKEISNSKDNKREQNNRVYEVVLHLAIDELIPFSEQIGFRYCCHKSQRLEAGVSYKRLRNEVTRQHNWIVNRVDQITNFTTIKMEDPTKIVGTKNAIQRAVKELQEQEALLHIYAIPTTHDITDHLIKGTKFGKFRSKGFPTAEDFLKQVGALDWFLDDNKTSYGVGKATDMLPTMNMKVLSRIPVGDKPVYDISVEKVHSFLAEGIVAHNCMIAHGAARFLKERLYDQSDPYDVVICETCGNFATTRTECKSCASDNVTTVNMPYVSKLVIQELNAMLIKCKISAKT